MNTYDIDSKDYFILKLKGSDSYLSFYDNDFKLSRIYGAFIFNEFLFRTADFGFYKLEHFEKIPIIILDKEKINAKKWLFISIQNNF